MENFLWSKFVRLAEFERFDLFRTASKNSGGVLLERWRCQGGVFALPLTKPAPKVVELGGGVPIEVAELGGSGVCRIN